MTTIYKDLVILAWCQYNHMNVYSGDIYTVKKGECRTVFLKLHL